MGKTILSYFGGKSNFSDFIYNKIPKDIDSYIEPFSGSMAIYFGNDFSKVKNIIFNDKNIFQANLISCAKDYEKLNDLIVESLSSGELSQTSNDFRENYKKLYSKWIKNDFLDTKDFDIPDFEKAVIYAFLITSSFSGVYPRGGGFSGVIKAKTQKEKDKLKLSTFLKKLNDEYYQKKLDGITSINSLDFEEIITKYDDEKAFIYLDPPYFDLNDKRLNWYGSKKEDMFGRSSHERLADLIKNCKSRWALSYYYFDDLEKWFPKDKFRWEEKKFFRSSAVGGNNANIKKTQDKGVELLIMNYDQDGNKL